jgi:hypothetical protein
VTAKFDLGPLVAKTSQSCWHSFAVVFRVNLSPVTRVGTDFRLAAYIRATLVTSDCRHSKNCAVSNQVPLGRYFVFVGSLLLGMLFIADWYLPSASSQIGKHE